MIKIPYGVLFCGAVALFACGSGSNGAEDAAGGGGGGGTSAQGGSAGTGNTGAAPEPGVLFIQEDELGFSAVDGKILPREGSTSVTGYTGTGFADPDSGLGTAISWAVRAEAAGTYSFLWRYAFGGTATNLRDARLLVNGSEVSSLVSFPYTNSWNDWLETDVLELPLDAGSSFIQFVALNESGLANIDYLKVLGEGIAPDTASFSLVVDQNDPAGGSVSFGPNQGFYPAGTLVTLTAEANPGYFFQSWSGDVTSANPEHDFEIAENTHVTALFLPDGTTQDPELVGYAAVQDDEGTPYLVTGGSLGQTVTATTLDELRSYLGSPEPYVVTFSGLFEGADSIHVASHKTLLGLGDSAHLMGIELEIAGSRNVIVRNVSVSHVVAEGTGTANDAIVISDSKNVWVDHCKLFSDLTHGGDFYDGLLEIKNEAAFVTVSWTEFHDHYKVSLISSGDEQVADTAIRATYHHNFFHDTGSRLPSIRFGKAHVFNNYYLDNMGGSGVNSRMGAVVKVENNYFQNTDDPIGSWDSPTLGSWDVSNNLYDACSGSQPTVSTGSLSIPYQYALDDPADVPALVSAGAGVGRQ